MKVIINKLYNFYNMDSELNQDVFDVILEKKESIRVCLLSYGAAICRLMIPNRHGTLENLVLGYENYRDYYKNPVYAGATLAPTGGFISGCHTLAGGSRSFASCALAIEAQDIPDVCHLLPARCKITSPGETYRRTIIFSFPSKCEQFVKVP